MRDQTLPSASAAFSPTRVVQVDLASPLPALEAGDGHAELRYGSALVLVRLQAEPIGILDVPLPPAGLPPELLAARIWDQLRGPIQDAATRHGASSPPSAAADLAEHCDRGYPQRRMALLTDAAPISAVVCTRDRPDRLRSCLHALSQQDHPRYDITVVDNAPSSDATARLVEGISGPVPVRRIVEPQPGLSRARNTGLRATTAGLVAFLDDDELPDEHWLSELALGFQVGPAVGCVTGMILPASLETRAQAWFEQYGGHSKNRGFTQLIFDPLDRSSQHPLYPLPPYGAGGNMAFRREALLAVGGFDLALGAGTLAVAGEDTAAFADIMLEGYQLVYQPSALLWHNHHQDFTDLQRQLYGYGAGLTAYFVRMLIRRPKVLGQLLALAPRGIRDLLARDSQRFVSMQAEFPPELLAEHRRGMLRGLTAYPRAVWQQRRAPVQGGEGA